MGSAGRAIGPDGKPLKQSNNKGHNNNNNNNRNNQKGGKVNKGNRQGGPQNRGNERFRPSGPPPLMSLNGRAGNMRGGPMPGPGFMNNAGPPMGGIINNPMMGNGGPMMGGGGPMMGSGGPPLRGSGPDPHGNYGYFRGEMPIPRSMGDERNGSNQPAGITTGLPINKPGFENPNNFGNNNQSMTINNNKRALSPPPTSSAIPGEVPGFGNNSSIHELFGKMVWKKMEGLRDQAVIDRLQNRIMNLIHDALADQSAGTPTQPSLGNVQSQYNPSLAAKQEVNFRNF
ncbi:unnamed protein product [Auanema sp. JU1783]|nr:unnamed protein product [Auanema sp. JU1783]